MNDLLARVIDETCPKFNTDVVEGTSRMIFKTFPGFLDNYFKSAIRSLNTNINLSYLGYRVMAPEEEFEKMLANDGNKTNYDLAPSDLYMVEYVFQYNGKQFSKHLYLPFTDIGNLITISSTKYVMVPVLSDTVISPSYKEVFVRLLKDKITFKSVIKNFMVNGQVTQGHVVYANIMKINKQQINDQIGKPLLATVLYFMGQLGLKGTMEKYLNTDNYVITNGDTSALEKDYNVYSSMRLKPRNHKEDFYKPHDIKICIHKTIPSTPLLENIVYGLIYVFDMLPGEEANCIAICNAISGLDAKFKAGEIDADTYHKLKDRANKDEILFWRIILGNIACMGSFSNTRIIEDTYDHFETLEGYMDNLIKTKLKEGGVYVEDFYDLLAYIMNNFNAWLMNSKDYGSDINNKYIDYPYYVLYDIIIGFNKVIFSINKRASKNNSANISEREVIKVFNNELSTRKIFGLIKSSAMNLCASLADYTADIMYPKCTALLEHQARGNGVKRGSNSQFPEATKTLKGNDLLYGSLLFLNKTAPTPTLRLNLYAQYNVNTGKIIVPPELAPTIEKLDILLRGRTENALIDTLESDTIEELK